jgi:hypothetical protein
LKYVRHNGLSESEFTWQAGNGRRHRRGAGVIIAVTVEVPRNNRVMATQQQRRQEGSAWRR